MREALARSLSGLVNLDEDDHSERPVDRIHAIALAQTRAVNDARFRAILVPLGRLLLPLVDDVSRKYEAEGIKALQLFIAGEKRLRVREETAWFIAKQSIEEARSQRCKVCKGVTDVPDGTTSIPDVERMAGKTVWEGPVPLKTCPACKGTGKRRWTDAERAEVVGEAARFDAAFSFAHGVISMAIHEALRGYVPALKDWGN